MPLRALTYNILVGGEERLPFIRDIIRSQNPDVVAIQEANSRENVEALARDLEMALVFGEANSAFHVALLSRLPITYSVTHRAPELQKALLEAHLRWEGQTVRVFNTHLKAHPDQEEWRLREIEAALRVVGPASAEASLLMGDFNALSPVDSFTPDEAFPEEEVAFAQGAYALPRLAIARVLATGYTDLYRALRPAEPGYTAKTPTPVVRIDYIFASPSLARRAVNCDRVESPLVILASDHMPVRADFE